VIRSTGKSVSDYTPLLPPLFAARLVRQLSSESAAQINKTPGTATINISFLNSAQNPFHSSSPMNPSFQETLKHKKFFYTILK
jgi:hypothetical protein